MEEVVLFFLIHPMHSYGQDSWVGAHNVSGYSIIIISPSSSCHTHTHTEGEKKCVMGYLITQKKMQIFPIATAGKRLGNNSINHSLYVLPTLFYFIPPWRKVSKNTEVQLK